MRFTVLGNDATIMGTGFINTAKGAAVTSTKALEFFRMKHEADGIKYCDTAARDARRTTRLERRALIAAKGAREYYSGRMRRCAALAGREEEEFLGSIRSLMERRAVARMRTILRRQIFSRSSGRRGVPC